VDESDIEDARMRYHFALAPEDYERLPFYSALLHDLEADQLALELLASVRTEQRNAMIILASLHYLALCDHEVLGPIYEAARHGELLDPGDAARQVLGVIHARPELVQGELWRSTQTNEPGRSAALQAIIGDFVSSDAEINIIEVGTSAGINLYFDQFPVRATDDGNPLTLICEDITPVDRSKKLPIVSSRVGIDPHPLDVMKQDDRRWLKACLWPEERRRHERFDAVVAQKSNWPSSVILTGTAEERLSDAFAFGEANRLTIVFNTWVAFYFSPDERERYFADLLRRCESDDVAWISIESTLVPLPGVVVDKDAHHRGASQIVVTRPGSSPQLWGWCHAHGRWLEKASVS
jgi:hypothetical protein